MSGSIFSGDDRPFLDFERMSDEEIDTRCDALMETYGRPMTFEEIGYAIGVSRQRVEQIEKVALDKMRRNPWLRQAWEQMAEDRAKRRNHWDELQAWGDFYIRPSQAHTYKAEVGQRFGLYTIASIRRSGRHPEYKIVCDCGTHRWVRRWQLFREQRCRKCAIKHNRRTLMDGGARLIAEGRMRRGGQ